MPECWFPRQPLGVSVGPQEMESTALLHTFSQLFVRVTWSTALTASPTAGLTVNSHPDLHWWSAFTKHEACTGVRIKLINDVILMFPSFKVDKTLQQFCSIVCCKPQRSCYLAEMCLEISVAVVCLMKLRLWLWWTLATQWSHVVIAFNWLTVVHLSSHHSFPSSTILRGLRRPSHWAEGVHTEELDNDLGMHQVFYPSLFDTFLSTQHPLCLPTTTVTSVLHHQICLPITQMSLWDIFVLQNERGHQNSTKMQRHRWIEWLHLQRVGWQLCDCLFPSGKGFFFFFWKLQWQQQQYHTIMTLFIWHLCDNIVYCVLWQTHQY